MSTGEPRKLLGQILKEMGKIHEGQVQEALGVQKEEGGFIGQIFVRLGAIDESELMVALGRQAGLEYVDLSSTTIATAVIDRIDASTANLLHVVPIGFENDTLTVAMSDPMNASILDDLRFQLGCEIKGAIADDGQISKAIAEHYGTQVGSVSDIVKEVDEAASAAAQGGPIDLSDREAAAKATPIVKLLNFVLFQAIRDQASDIHLEPFEDDFRVRYRVDGLLYELDPPPKHLAEPLISRVKVMSNLDIAETRMPQDGRIELMIAGRPVDLRVSTLPTRFGESCVIRILDRDVVALDLERVGLRDESLSTVRKFLEKPNGIVLVTGPTGSGKTTTLYSALSEANDIAKKIITTEDPVEYDLEGIIQIPIAEDIGVSYASCLRSILRHDPDIILVGEIRDHETAQISIEASLTGHLVFSTLHTNDAPSAVTRMVDIGIEPFLLGATLEGIVAQRLVRRICPSCRVFYEPTEDLLLELELRPEDVIGKKFAMGEGCDDCHGSGYRGRVGIFEILEMTPRIREAVLEERSTGDLNRLARESGMRTLREEGLVAIFDGLTTVEEIVRETIGID